LFQSPRIQKISIFQVVNTSSSAVKIERHRRRRRLLKRRETLSDWCLVSDRSRDLRQKKNLRRTGGSLHSIDGSLESGRQLLARRRLGSVTSLRMSNNKAVQPPHSKNHVNKMRSPSWSSCGEPSRPTSSQSESISGHVGQQQEQYGGSQATLRPSTHSVSELSCISGEPEMEFDLYDCDIDNVMRAPGSMFAAAYWDGDEAATPTLDLEMVQLFPKEEDEAEEVVHCRNNRRNPVKCLDLLLIFLNYEIIGYVFCHYCTVQYFQSAWKKSRSCFNINLSFSQTEDNIVLKTGSIYSFGTF
jgi:hypothetical protein